MANRTRSHRGLLLAAIEDHWHDLIAGGIAISLVIGVLVLTYQAKDVPEFLVAAVSAAIAYVFRGAVATK